MVTTCFVCGERNTPDSQLTFHRLPKTKSRLENWLKALRREDMNPDRFKHAKICSKHFTPDAWDNSNLRGKSLFSDAVPTLNLGFDVYKKKEAQKEQPQRCPSFEFTEEMIKKSPQAALFAIRQAKRIIESKKERIQKLQVAQHRLRSRIGRHKRRVFAIPMEMRRKLGLNRTFQHDVYQQIATSLISDSEDESEEDDEIKIKQEPVSDEECDDDEDDDSSGSMDTNEGGQSIEESSPEPQEEAILGIPPPDPFIETSDSPSPQLPVIQSVCTVRPPPPVPVHPSRILANGGVVRPVLANPFKFPTLARNVMGTVCYGVPVSKRSKHTQTRVMDLMLAHEQSGAGDKPLTMDIFQSRRDLTVLQSPIQDSADAPPDEWWKSDPIKEEEGVRDSDSKRTDEETNFDRFGAFVARRMNALPFKHARFLQNEFGTLLFKVESGRTGPFPRKIV